MKQPPSTASHEAMEFFFGQLAIWAWPARSENGMLDPFTTGSTTCDANCNLTEGPQSKYRLSSWNRVVKVATRSDAA